MYNTLSTESPNDDDDDDDDDDHDDDHDDDDSSLSTTLGMRSRNLCVLQHPLLQHGTVTTSGGSKISGRGGGDGEYSRSPRGG